MTRFFFVFSLLLSGALFSVTANAAPDVNAPRRTISVTGEAEVRVVPDQVIISMTAESRGTALLETQKRNDQTIAALIAFAHKKMDVEEKYIQTDYTSVQPTYKNCRYDDEMSGKCSPLEITYYSVRKGIQIKLKTLDHYEALVSQALQLGITHVDNVQFTTTKLREHRDKARDMAAKASQEKAKALAETLGMELGKPITINANQYHTFYRHGAGGRGQNRMMQNAIQSAPSGGGGDASALALGQINISAQVNVTYEME